MQNTKKRINPGEKEGPGRIPEACRPMSTRVPSGAPSRRRRWPSVAASAALAAPPARRRASSRPGTAAGPDVEPDAKPTRRGHRRVRRRVDSPGRRRPRGRHGGHLALRTSAHAPRHRAALRRRQGARHRPHEDLRGRARRQPEDLAADQAPAAAQEAPGAGRVPRRGGETRARGRRAPTGPAHRGPVQGASRDQERLPRSTTTTPSVTLRVGEEPEPPEVLEVLRRHSVYSNQTWTTLVKNQNRRRCSKF